MTFELRSTRLLSFKIKYCMRDLCCDPNNWDSSFDVGKLSVYYQIAIKNLKKKRGGYQTNFYMTFHQKDDL